MKNKMTDLNNILFEALERLSDEDLTPEQLEREINRCDAINKVAQTVISNASVAIKAQEMIYEYGDTRQVDIPLLSSGE